MPQLTTQTLKTWQLRPLDGQTRLALPPPDAVHLWLLSLDQPLRPLAGLTVTLDPAEHARAARFHFAHDRLRFIAARGQLRAVLAAYTGMAPGHIAFAYADAGKPRLAGMSERVQFNLSHCGGWALLAVTAGLPVGADIEALRALPEAAEVARAHFSPAEHRAWLQLPQEQRLDGFFACWTRKEAVVKALGGGLSIPLDSFEVSVDPAAQAYLVSLEGAPAGDWTLWGEKIFARHWAAVAVRSPGATFRFLRANDPDTLQAAPRYEPPDEC